MDMEKEDESDDAILVPLRILWILITIVAPQRVLSADPPIVTETSAEWVRAQNREGHIDDCITLHQNIQ
jgi:hypothetical protein